MSSEKPPRECANCGAAIPPGAKACPECGADERTGWRESSLYDGLELPDSAFEEEAEEAARRQPPPKVNGIAWYWWLIALLLVLLALAGRWLV